MLTDWTSCFTISILNPIYTVAVVIAVVNPLVPIGYTDKVNYISDFRTGVFNLASMPTKIYFIPVTLAQ